MMTMMIDDGGDNNLYSRNILLYFFLNWRVDCLVVTVSSCILGAMMMIDDHAHE